MADRSDPLERLARSSSPRQPRSSAALWLILLLVVSGVLGWQTRAHWRGLITGDDDSTPANDSAASTALTPPAVVPAVPRAPAAMHDVATAARATTAPLPATAPTPTPPAAIPPATIAPVTTSPAPGISAVAVIGQPLAAPPVALMAAPNITNDAAVQDARYLVRAAQLRITVERDVRGAVAMLEEADALLRNDGRAEQLPLRAAIAADIAMLRPAAQLEGEIIHARLAALDARWDVLPLTQAKFQAAAPGASAPPDTGWRGYAQGLGAYLQTLIRVRTQRGSGVGPLLDPAQGELARQALHLLSLRAELALLRGQQPAYLQALTRAGELLEQRFLVADRNVAQARAELSALARIDVAPPRARLSALGLITNSVAPTTSAILPAAGAPTSPVAAVPPVSAVAPPGAAASAATAGTPR